MPKSVHIPAQAQLVTGGERLRQHIYKTLGCHDSFGAVQRIRHPDIVGGSGTLNGSDVAKYK